MMYPLRHNKKLRRKKADIPPLSDQYYKNRKQLVLWSGVLFAWEFIGIELNEIPFPNINIQIKSPDAAPWVLISLVLYFGYRTLIEWFHMPFARRYVKITLWDFRVSLLIPIVALLIIKCSRVPDTKLLSIL